MNFCKDCGHKVGGFFVEARCEAKAERDPVNGKRILPIRELPTCRSIREEKKDCRDFAQQYYALY